MDFASAAVGFPNTNLVRCPFWAIAIVVETNFFFKCSILDMVSHVPSRHSLHITEMHRGVQGTHGGSVPAVPYVLFPVLCASAPAVIALPPRRLFGKLSSSESLEKPPNQMMDRALHETRRGRYVARRS